MRGVEEQPQREAARGGRASAPAQPRRRSPLLLTVQIVFAVALVAVVARGLWWATVEPQASHGQAVPVEAPASGGSPSAGPTPAPAGLGAAPRQLGQYRLVESVTGPQAVAEMNRLHGTDVGVARGYVAHYDGGGTAWVGEARDEATARRLNERMVERIGRGTAMFQDLKELSVDGQRVYTVVGQGQRHYFYQQATRVVWLTAPAGGEEAFLRAALEAIR